MDFEQLIIDYKENPVVSSPIWIWFIKECKICKSNIPRKDGTTGGMVTHIKRHHGFLSKVNAWKVYEELSALKESRLANKRKLDTQEEP